MVNITFWLTSLFEPMRLHTAENAVPMYCRTPTKVPLHFREEVRKGLETDVMKGILEKVPAGEVDRCGLATRKAARP